MKSNGFYLLLCILCTSYSAYSQLVTSSLDDGSDGTLRKEIADTPAGGTVTFDESITEINLESEIVIDKDLTINEEINDFPLDISSLIDINAGEDSRVFRISGGNVTMNELRIQGGTAEEGGGIYVDADSRLSMIFSILRNNTALRNGGGIFNNGGNLDLNFITIIENEARGNALTEGGGGIYSNGGFINLQDGSEVIDNVASGTEGSGGGIFNNGGEIENFGSTGGLSFDSFAYVRNNTANGHGGGICSINHDEPLDIQYLNIIGNKVIASPGSGGGIYYSGPGNLMLKNTFLDDNEAATNGGGIYMKSGELTVSAASLNSNVANGNLEGQGGGGVYLNDDTGLELLSARISKNKAMGDLGSGGGILANKNVNIRFLESSASENTASLYGGGIAVFGLKENDQGSTWIGESSINGNKVGTEIDGVPIGKGGGAYVSGDHEFGLVGSISNNVATSQGGGIWVDTGEFGAGSTIAGTRLENNRVLMGNTPGDGGGAIYNNSGSIELDDATSIENNKALGSNSSGGAILSKGGSVLLDIQNEVSTNSAVLNGGALAILGGTLDIKNTEKLRFFQFKSNEATGTQDNSDSGNGGAIYLSGPTTTATLTNITLTENSAANFGGGIMNTNGARLFITKSTIDTNTANFGGGIYSEGEGEFSLTKSTISDNEASTSGGGIYYASTVPTEIFASTIAYNEAETEGGGILADGEVAIRSTIVARNTAATGSEIFGGVLSNNYNMILNDDFDSFEPKPNDILRRAPMLGALEYNNRAETRTRALQQTSFAIDAGDPSDISEDQLGRPVFSEARDIGAYETNFTAPTLSVTTNELITPNRIIVYPIPATNNLFIEDTDNTINQPVHIYSVMGTIVKSIEARDRMDSIDISDLASGTYFLKIENGEHTVMKNFIVK